MRPLFCFAMLAQAACVIDWAGYEAGGGGASAGGGSNTGGSASSDDCGRIGLLHDDFGDQAASAWYSIPGDTLGWATVVDGRVQVVSSSDYGALVSNWGWDLREGYVSVEVPTVPLVGNTSLVLTQGRQTSGKDLTILVSNGEIFAQSNGQQIGPSVAYSPAAHRSGVSAGPAGPSISRPHRTVKSGTSSPPNRSVSCSLSKLCM